MNTITVGPSFRYPDHGSQGMTPRDYFAAKAMQAIISVDTSPSMSIDTIAKCAWMQADAMLAAREVVS